MPRHKSGQRLDKQKGVAGSQYTSFRFTARLIEAGNDASIGTVGDCLRHGDGGFWAAA
jgi:hypothetical protein